MKCGKPSSGTLIQAFGGLWAVVVVACILTAFRVDSQPAPAAIPPSTAAPPPAAAGNGHQLLLFAHPDCPCTRATLAEMAKLLTRIEGRVEATIYFYKPHATLEETQASENWKLAAAIPGLLTLHDPAGASTGRFGASTSGQALLYSPDGHLVFSGGLTVSRGHQGDSPGVAEIIRLIAGERAGLVQTPVFGCALADPNPSILREQPTWSKH